MRRGFASRMAQQKHNHAHRAEAAASQQPITGPLFEDAGPLDLDTYGGLVVLEDGQVAEVAPLRFIPEGGDTSLDGERVQPLPFTVDEDGQISWIEQPYDPNTVTIGLETESLTMDPSNAGWWEISPNGRELHYPHALAVEPAEERGHQPELLKNTTESGSPVEKLARGPAEFRDLAEDEKYSKQLWMGQNGLMAVPLSLYPEYVSMTDIAEHPYPQMLTRVMPRILEYAACLSEQINIQWKSPEAGAFALNAYELLGPVLGLVTAASPARDGSLHTTLSQHYEHNPVFRSAENPEDYEELARLVRAELGPFMDDEPYDWRDLARGYGSPAGGVIAQAAPVDIESMLREGDRQLRAGEAMTVNRVLGPHANRWRPDKNLVEISNLSLGGDHPDKMAAAEETVIKTVIALQEYFDDPEADGQYKPEWQAVIPMPQQRHNIGSRQRFVDAARANTMIFAMFGKDRKMFDADWQERTPTEIFDTFADFIAEYAPEPLSEETVAEIHATLKQPPVFENSLRHVPDALLPGNWPVAGGLVRGMLRALRQRHPRRFTINDPLGSFFEKRSRLTATEAIRMAKPLDNMDPPVTLTHVIRRFARYANTKRLERHDAKQAPEAVPDDQLTAV